MANSRKQPLNNAAGLHRVSIRQHVEQLLAQTLFPTLITKSSSTSPTLLVGFSGGLDSAVLLHLLSQLREKYPLNLHAMHVHHGLSPHADDWAAFCTQICSDYHIPLRVARVKVSRDSGLGLEAAAREARYRALVGEKPDWLCLAHHQNDQAETLFLQLLRGAGVKGLAAMAAIDEKRKLLRPLLTFSRNELEYYAKQYGLTWVEDESNLDMAYDRNYLRHQVLPVLTQRYPAVLQTLSRSAEHFAAASQLQDDLAKIDLARLVKANDPNCIVLAAWRDLNPTRQANVLRWWLNEQAAYIPSSAQLLQMLRQISATNNDSRLKIKLGQDLWLRRYQDDLYIVQERVLEADFSQLWHGEPQIVLPDGSHLICTRTQGRGLTPRVAETKGLIIRYRQGGERLRTELGRPSRSLKTLLQAANMPIWQRERLPLIYKDDDLIYVPNIGARYDLNAKPQETGYSIAWRDITGQDGDKHKACL